MHFNALALADLYDKISESINNRELAIGIFLIYVKLLMQLTMTSCFKNWNVWRFLVLL